MVGSKLSNLVSSEKRKEEIRRHMELVVIITSIRDCPNESFLETDRAELKEARACRKSSALSM